MRLPREAREEVLHVLVQQGVVVQPVGEGIQFLLVGQVAIDDQEADLDERGLVGQLFDWNAAVAQNAFLSIEKGNPALAGTGVSIARVHGDVAGLSPELADVDGFLVLRAREYRQFDGLAIGQMQNRVIRSDFSYGGL